MLDFSCTDRFDFGSSEYRDLARRAPCSAFQSPAWLSAFYAHLVDPRTQEAVVVVGRDPRTDVLMALVPLVRDRARGRTSIRYASADVTDYACPVVDPDAASGLEGRTVWRTQLSELLGPFDRLVVEPVRDEDTTVWSRLLAAGKEELEHGHHHVRPEQPFTAWCRTQLGGRKAGQIARKLRGLRGEGAVRLDVLDAEQTEAALAWAQRTRRGRFEEDPIQRPEVLDFYRHVARSDEQPGIARCYRLTVDDKTVAVCFGIVDDASFRYLVLAADYTDHRRFSPGTLILHLAMEEWTQAGGAVFDFTIGDEAYKQRDFRCIRQRLYRYVQ